jgi:hypothetical protein
LCFRRDEVRIPPYEKAGKDMNLKEQIPDVFV